MSLRAQWYRLPDAQGLGGSTTAIAGIGGGGQLVPADGDVLGAEHRGSVITVFVNGAPLGTITDAHKAAATGVGWRVYRTPARFRHLNQRA